MGRREEWGEGKEGGIWWGVGRKEGGRRDRGRRIVVRREMSIACHHTHAHTHLITLFTLTPSQLHTLPTHTRPRYDLYDVEIAPHKDYHTPMGTQYAPAGYFYIKVILDEVLFEGGRSVRYIRND